MLELKRKIVYNHGPELIATFIEVFGNEWVNEFNIIVEALEYLQEYYTRSRYPFLLRGEVISPSEFITKEIAEKAINEYLKRQGIQSHS